MGDVYRGLSAVQAAHVIDRAIAHPGYAGSRTGRKGQPWAIASRLVRSTQSVWEASARAVQNECVGVHVEAKHIVHMAGFVAMMRSGHSAPLIVESKDAKGKIAAMGPREHVSEEGDVDIRVGQENHASMVGVFDQMARV